MPPEEVYSWARGFSHWSLDTNNRNLMKLPHERKEERKEERQEGKKEGRRKVKQEERYQERDQKIVRALSATGLNL